MDRNQGAATAMMQAATSQDSARMSSKSAHLSAPTGRRIAAQGNALGKVPNDSRVLKGRRIRRGNAIHHP